MQGLSMNIKETTTDFIKQSKRVLKVARKPDREEFFDFSKVTALGIAIIGLIGFIIVLIGQLLGL